MSSGKPSAVSQGADAKCGPLAIRGRCCRAMARSSCAAEFYANSSITCYLHRGLVHTLYQKSISSDTYIH